MGLTQKISEKHNLNPKLTELIIVHNPSAMKNFLKLNKDHKNNYYLKLEMIKNKYKKNQKKLFFHYKNSLPYKI